jgi:hypothetical protein
MTARVSRVPQRAAVLFTAGLSAATLLPNPVGAQCRIVAVHDARSSLTGRTVGVRVAALEPRWAMPITLSWANRALGWPVRPKTSAIAATDHRVRAVQTVFGEVLMELLGSPESGSPASDFVLHAELTGLDAGNRAARGIPGLRPFVGDSRASTAILALLLSNEDRPVATLTCDRSTLGGPLGEGGLLALWQTGESLVRQNLRRIGQNLVVQLSRVHELGTRLARRKPKRETGELRYRSRVWRERPPDSWSLKDAASVVGTFMTQTSRTNIVGGPPVVAKGVHTLWFSAAAYEAIRRAPQLVERDPKSLWIHPYFHAFSDQTLDVLEAESESTYAIAVWPFDNPPFLWDLDAIMAATFLRRADGPGERIPPVALLGAPWPPALFLFPRHDASGEPLIVDTSTSLELHSTINGHEIVSKFDIARFALRHVSELGIRRRDGAR